MQYVAEPAICLLAGLGLARLLGRLRSPQRGLRISLALLGSIAVVELSDEVVRPYKTVQDQQVRQFALALARTGTRRRPRLSEAGSGVRFGQWHWELGRSPSTSAISEFAHHGTDWSDP